MRLQHHTDLAVIGHLCACSCWTKLTVGSCSASSSSLSLKCDLFLYFWCVFQTSSVGVCVCVWSLHFHCIHNSSFSCCWYKTVGVCFVSHWLVNFLMCLFSLGALPCQTVWRGELLGEFKRPLGLQRKVLGKY